MARPRHQYESIPLRSPVFDADRTAIAAATEAFLAKGGKIEQVGQETAFVEYQWGNSRPSKPVPNDGPVSPEKEQAMPVDAAVDMTASLVGKVMAQAVLGRSPRQIALSLGFTEKHVRQIGRDYHIQFRQR